MCLLKRHGSDAARCRCIQEHQEIVELLLSCLVVLGPTLRRLVATCFSCALRRPTESRSPRSSWLMRGCRVVEFEWPDYVGICSEHASVQCSRIIGGDRHRTRCAHLIRPCSRGLKPGVGYLPEASAHNKVSPSRCRQGLLGIGRRHESIGARLGPSPSASSLSTE